MVLLRHMSLSAVLLGAFAVAGTSMVALTYDNTAKQIAANERAFLLKSLHTLVTPDMHDNDLFSDTIQITDKENLGSKKPVTIYRARKNGNDIAAIMTVIAPDGYNGDIELLIAIDDMAKLIGVRVTRHKETPGLGDAVETSRSDWILGFNGKHLQDPGKQGWRVKRDGGVFDQFTGATITPRAIVKAVYKALQYYDHHKMMIYNQASMEMMHDSHHDKGKANHE